MAGEGAGSGPQNRDHEAIIGLENGHTMELKQEESMLNHLDNYREEVSGVSLDEEMVNLVKFQAAYTAAAKLVSAADELLQTTINMIR